MILGITGGTGCGKTTLLRCIEQKGGVIFDCDAVYHRLLETGGTMLDSIEKAFPGTVVDGKLQRKALGSLVFADPKLLLRLNAITHKAVKNQIVKELEKAPALFQ